MKISAKRLLTPDGWREGLTVTVEKGMIVAVAPGQQGDLSCEILTPGLFDIHAHGGEGYYTADLDPQALARYLQALAWHGITDVLLTTGSFPSYDDALSLFRGAMERQAAGTLDGARIRGVHLEGPFLSPVKCGAMLPENMPQPSIEAFQRLFGPYLSLISLVTVAPEVEGAKELMAHLLRQGLRVQVGHTDAQYEEASAAFALGADSLCHSFNACRSIHHRQPGVVTAALLSSAVYCEVICDLKHLHPGIVTMIYRLKGAERMIVVSDSGAPTGLPDGEYVFGGKTYRVIDGTNRVKGGQTLSGGACYIDRSVANLIDIGISSAHAYQMASQTPARYLGLNSLGSIRPGCQAHLAAWEADGVCSFTLIDELLTENR